jgi:hypothetical protein
MPVSQAVRYDAMNAMLLNEFLKEHRRARNWKQPSRASKRKSKR